MGQGVDVIGTKRCGNRVATLRRATIEGKPRTYCRFLVFRKIYGISISQNARATIEYCEIVGSGVDNVSITTGSTPYFYLCRIHDAQQHGVRVSDNGRGILEYCTIAACQQANVAINSGGDPQFQRDTISQSQDYGVAVFDGGRGTIEHCTLTDNARGALSIEPGCKVINKQNTLHSMANKHP